VIEHVFTLTSTSNSDPTLAKLEDDLFRGNEGMQLEPVVEIDDWSYMTFRDDRMSRG
jgi:hypothetical protein